MFFIITFFTTLYFFSFIPVTTSRNAITIPILQEKLSLPVERSILPNYTAETAFQLQLPCPTKSNTFLPMKKTTNITISNLF